MAKQTSIDTDVYIPELCMYQSEYNRRRALTDIKCTEDEGKTVSDFLRETEITHIMRRIDQTQVIDYDVREAVFGDFSSVQSYHVMQNQIAEAKAMFDELPQAVRERMDNDPAKLIAYINDERNVAEGIRLGIFMTPPPPQEAVPVGAAAPPTGGGQGGPSAPPSPGASATGK